MISFIVIGRNEGWKLSLCFEGIQKTIAYNKIKDFEIIYVDSKSTDESLDKAKSLRDITVYSIIGEYNAAIARNIGARESKGEILFFIDGDVELIPDFLGHAISDDHKELRYDCVTGYLDNMYYDVSWEFIGRVQGGYKGALPSMETKQPVNGGIFLIKRGCWDLVNGMKTKYKKNQDLDLVLRLSKKRINFIRIPYLMGLHHTVDYRNENRMWEILFSGHLLFPAVTARDHLFTFAKLKHTLREKYTAVLLLMATVSLLFSFTAFKIFFSFYLLIVLIRVLMNTLITTTSSISKFQYYFMRMAYQLMADGIFIYGFFFFSPREKKMFYKKVN